MADFYEEMQGIASSLLAEFDQKRPGDADPASNGIFYVAVVPGTGPADDPGPSVPTPFKIDGAARGVSFKFVDGTNVVRTDRQVTMAVHPDVTPDEKGFVLIDGVRHKVIEVRRKPEAGTPVAYVLIIRK